METIVMFSEKSNTEEPKVAIIIVNWNKKSLLETCLSSIEKKTEYSNYFIVVVDNGSSDGSPELVRDKFPSVDLLMLKRNTGFVIGSNSGIRRALRDNPDYILLLNNDTIIIQNDWLRRIVEIAEIDERIGIIGCEIVYPNGKIQSIGHNIDFKTGLRGLQLVNPDFTQEFPDVFEVDCVFGAFFLIKEKVVDAIGFLDEGFSPFQHEESDFCLRAKRAGYKVCTTLNVKVVHLHGESMREIRSDYYNFANQKNLIRLILLNFSVSWIVCHLVYEIREFTSCLFERKSGVQKRFLFKLEIRKDWRRRTTLYLSAWFLNARNLGEILAKRRNRTRKILPVTAYFID
jgi:GT2 family glycosyltransferase